MVREELCRNNLPARSRSEGEEQRATRSAGRQCVATSAGEEQRAPRGAGEDAARERSSVRGARTSASGSGVARAGVGAGEEQYAPRSTAVRRWRGWQCTDAPSVGQVL